MTITDKIIHSDGTAETREIEVAGNYFDVPTPQPTEAEKLQAQIDYLAMMTEVVMI